MSDSGYNKVCERFGPGYEKYNSICAHCGKRYGHHFGFHDDPTCERHNDYELYKPNSGVKRFTMGTYTNLLKKGTRVRWNIGTKYWTCTVVDQKDAKHSGFIGIRVDLEFHQYHTLDDKHSAHESDLEVLSQPPEHKDFKLGDRVEVIYFDKENVRTSTATVVHLGGSSITTMLDTPWVGANADPWPLHMNVEKKDLEYAKSLGFSEKSFQEKRSWSVAQTNEISFITRILGSVKPTENKTEKETMSQVNLTKLVKGDRILVQVKDREGFSYAEEATVLFYDGSCCEVHIYMDREIAFPGTVQSHIPQNMGLADEQSSRDLKLELNAPRVIKFAANSNQVRCMKVLSKASDPKDSGKKDTGKEKDMTEKTGIVAMMKSDAEKMVWRSAATQFSNAMQGAILLAMKSQMEESKVAVLQEFLGTDFGNAIIRIFLGYGATYVPGFNQDPRVKRIAEEFRVSGMTKVSDEVLGTLFTYLMPAFTEAVKNLPPIQEAVPAALKPKASRKRVSANKRVAVENNPEIPVHEAAEEAAEAEAATA